MLRQQLVIVVRREVAETPEKIVDHAVARLSPGQTSALTVPGRPDQVGVARAFVADTLGKDHPLAEVAVLPCSELVTNSLLHSASGHDGGTITITLAQAAGLVRVEVTDDGAPGLPACRAEGRDDESGYGLRLVGALAARWGWRGDGAGTTTTWFEVAS